MAFIRGILDRIVLVAGIVAAGCVPSFIAQYRQRVGGQLDQVLHDIAPFQEIASQFHHGSLEELVRYHLASPDATFHSEGAAIQEMINSAEQLRRVLEALEHVTRSGSYTPSTLRYNSRSLTSDSSCSHTSKTPWPRFAPSTRK